MPILPDESTKTGHLKVNGTEIYFEDTGVGNETIIFSHALLLDTSLFAPQVAELKKRYRCIAYDHRGQGRSADHTHDHIEIDLLTEDVVAMIKELNLGRVHFCGLSMGGFVGMRLAARHPDLIRSLILMGTSADAEATINLHKYRILNFFARHLGPASVARAVAPIIYGKTTLADPARQADKAALVKQLGDNRKSIWRAVNGVIFRPGIYNELSKITAPTLVLVGAEDLCQPPHRATTIANGIKGARLEVIAKAGHAVTLEQASLVNALLIEFLQTL